MKKILVIIFLFCIMFSLVSCTKKEADYQLVLDHFELVGTRMDNDGTSEYGRYYYEYYLRDEEHVVTKIKVYENKYIEIIGKNYRVSYTLGYYYNKAGSYKADIYSYFAEIDIWYGSKFGTYRYSTNNLEASHTYALCEIDKWSYEGDTEFQTEEIRIKVNDSANETIKNALLDLYLYFANNNLEYA